MEITSRFTTLEVEHYHAIRCEQCGLIYTSPDPPASDIEKIYSGEDYLDLLFENLTWRQWVVSNHWLPVLKAIENNINKGSILDVGCSDGLFMDISSNRGWTVYGTDINKEKLACAQQRYGESVKYESIYDLQWPNNSFDAIRLCHVLEHLTEPKKALENLHRLLRQGGILNIGIPVFDEPLNLLVQKLPPSKFSRKLTALLAWIDPPHHITTWSTSCLQQLLEDCGFKLVWKSYRSDIFPWIDGFKKLCIFYRIVGVPMRMFGTGATIEVLAKKC